MMKRIAHGGQAGGMAVDSEHMLCHNLLENSS